jgi:hypothetical protein
VLGSGGALHEIQLVHEAKAAADAAGEGEGERGGSDDMLRLQCKAHRSLEVSLGRAMHATARVGRVRQDGTDQSQEGGSGRPVESGGAGWLRQWLAIRMDSKVGSSV